MDKGFDSEANLTMLLDKRLKFIMMADSNRAWLRNLEEKHKETMRVPSKLFHYQDDRYYAVTELLSRLVKLLSVNSVTRTFLSVDTFSRRATARTSP
jgi:hypothetical protein